MKWSINQNNFPKAIAEFITVNIDENFIIFLQKVKFKQNYIQPVYLRMSSSSY